MAHGQSRLFALNLHKQVLARGILWAYSTT